ncbi:macro domain-containing protein [Lentzea atacamensis]|uniref:Macro domain-containing protein n=2 Tax=Lentzea atacamensis TaxID=531938 RepID=A0ABX9EG82_9PSEU|nr:macro domain-containing protein [Lentzea atacamensis]
MGLIEVVMGDSTAWDATAMEATDEQTLEDYYVNSLLTAEEQERDDVAIPVISTGFPTERAVQIAATTIRSLAIIDRIRLVAFDDETHRSRNAGRRAAQGRSRSLTARGTTATRRRGTPGWCRSAAACGWATARIRSGSAPRTASTGGPTVNVTNVAAR